MSWRATTSDPNSGAVRTIRCIAVESARKAPINDRVVFIIEQCRGRRVLDVGCVDHEAARMQSPSWLHARLADAAESCLGVDVEAEAVSQLRHAGFNAVAHDICAGPGPLSELDPFDVVVAGEVIEHLGSPQMLFRCARELLKPGGVLIITTPNPYAPHRVRSGQLGLQWENVDHVLYAFPSGIAELGAREGLELIEWRVVHVPWRVIARRTILNLGIAVRDRFLRHHRALSGRGLLRLPVTGFYVSPLELAYVASARGTGFLGETAIYTLQKPIDDVVGNR